MTDDQLLDRYGLFSVKVPRYTSYPPANHFQPDIGARNQATWLEEVSAEKPVSVYVHIPFCRRLCWFCACRTQGTATLRPVEAYVKTLLAEIRTVSARLPKGVRLARLHLGGGTPSLLSADLVERLVEALFGAFEPNEGYEFSVEIDPTDAPPATIEAFARQGMTRASIGVQDFAPRVQQAIGRRQSIEETQTAVDKLRAEGISSLNFDLLYGLPWQTLSSLGETLETALAMAPDRIALYGYAHVPWMSKRQVMIDGDALPSPKERHRLTEAARKLLTDRGYVPLGIDHFATPEDSLAVAAREGRLRRNFQGYTDDTAETLIGLGASAISRFPSGYVQNAVATSAYARRIQEGRFGGHKGHVLSERDALVGEMIEGLMCQSRIDGDALAARYPELEEDITQALAGLRLSFPEVTLSEGRSVTLKPEYLALARIVAGALDRMTPSPNAHSIAV